MSANASANFTSSHDHDELFMRISSRMLTATDEASFLRETLADIGREMQVSRSYIFEVINDLWFNTYEWVAAGVSSHKEELQAISFADTQSYGELLNTLYSGQPYVISDVTSIDDEDARALLMHQGVSTLVTVPLFDKDVIVGMFGVDLCEFVPHWADSVINTIIVLGNILNNAKAYFKTQGVLQKKKSQAQALFDAFPYPIYVSSIDDYSIVFYNKAIADAFDVSQVAHKKCYEILQNLDAPCPFCTNAFLEKDAPPYVWHHRNSITGNEYKIIDRRTSWERTANARLSVAIDITDTLRLQREQVLEREANIAKGLFLANMSHELRTPLNGIIGMTHLADGANKNARVKGYLEKVQISSRNLLAIINDILDFSKLETNEITLEKLPFSFSTVLHEIQAILQVGADAKGIDLQCELDEKIFSALYGDALRLSQILLNLTNNALKFTSKGQVHISVHMVQDSPTEQLIELKVQDTGIGISKENIKKLFTAFTQAEASTTRNYGGTGLGLTITQHLVHLMKGSIRVESTLGHGATFICTIPFAKVLEEQSVAQSPSLPLDSADDISGIRVLLVEDNEINSHIATAVLEQYGCHVDNAEDGRIALDMLAKNTYDIVLMDIQMPHMDGLEATRHIRNDSTYDTLPVVAMSAHALVQDYEKSYEAGMQAHVIKPFAPEELRKVIYQFTSKPFRFKKG